MGISSIFSCVSAYLYWADSPSVKQILKQYYGKNKKNSEKTEINFKNSIIEEISKKRFLKAIEKEDITTIKELINQGFPLNSYISEERFTVVHYACKIGSIKSLRILIEKGNMDINFQDDIEKWTPLIICCINGHIECTEYLLKQGANTELKSETNHSALDYINELIEGCSFNAEKEKLNKIKALLLKKA